MRSDPRFVTNRGERSRESRPYALTRGRPKRGLVGMRARGGTNQVIGEDLFTAFWSPHIPP